ncbi:MAG TPA: TolC family protein [Vicinamibacterales bacterium]
MKRTVTKWSVVAAAALVLASAPPARAQKINVNDQHVQELIREAAARAGVSATGVSDTTAQATAGANGRPVVRLTLDDAIKLALDRNLDISVQRLNPQTFDFSMSALQSSYRPILTSSVLQQSQTTAPTSTLAGATTGILAGTQQFNAGLAQNIKWGGGSFVANFNNTRATTTSQTALFDPLYTPNWSAQYTQPLLRNFKIDTNRQQLVVTSLNQDISEIQLQATIINTLANVRNAYYNLVFAVQSVDVAKRSVDLAEQLVKDNQTRVEIGTMAPIDVVQAQSQAATQRQNLAAAEGTRRTNELALKRLIVNGTMDANWSADIDPADRPDFAPQPIDVPAAVARALANRTDLQQVKKNLQVNDVTLQLLRNQTLPQTDISARYGLIGQGGTQFISSGTGINRVVSSVIPGGYGDALSTLFQNKYPTWSFALNVSYPLGTSAAEASVARARVQLTQVEAQVHQIELQVATDVTTAATNVQNAVEQVQAAQAASQFAQKQLEAEQSKFEVGMSTNYFVVQAQRDLATAQNNELQAILSYRRAMVELERLQQTSLQNSNITIITATQGGGAGGANTAAANASNANTTTAGR